MKIELEFNNVEYKGREGQLYLEVTTDEAGQVIVESAEFDSVKTIDVTDRFEEIISMQTVAEKTQEVIDGF